MLNPDINVLQWRVATLENVRIQHVRQRFRAHPNFSSCNAQLERTLVVEYRKLMATNRRQLTTQGLDVDGDSVRVVVAHVPHFYLHRTVLLGSRGRLLGARPQHYEGEGEESGYLPNRLGARSHRVTQQPLARPDANIRIPDWGTRLRGRISTSFQLDIP